MASELLSSTLALEGLRQHLALGWYPSDIPRIYLSIRWWTGMSYFHWCVIAFYTSFRLYGKRNTCYIYISWEKQTTMQYEVLLFIFQQLYIIDHRINNYKCLFTQGTGITDHNNEAMLLTKVMQTLQAFNSWATNCSISLKHTFLPLEFHSLDLAQYRVK